MSAYSFIEVGLTIIDVLSTGALVAIAPSSQETAQAIRGLAVGVGVGVICAGIIGAGATTVVLAIGAIVMCEFGSSTARRLVSTGRL